jgi:hypothetical protein
MLITFSKHRLQKPNEYPIKKITNCVYLYCSSIGSSQTNEKI